MVLAYGCRSMLGKASGKYVSFYDGASMHTFRNIGVRREKGSLPVFRVSASGGGEGISFTVSPYSHSYWGFSRGSSSGFLNRMVYNGYPSVLSDFCFTEKKAGARTTLNDLGGAVGYVEEADGCLL